MAQWVKGLLCDLEDLSSDPRINIARCDPGELAGVGDEGCELEPGDSPGACEPVSTADLAVNNTRCYFKQGSREVVLWVLCIPEFMHECPLTGS